MKARPRPLVTRLLALGIFALSLRVIAVFLLWSPDAPAWTYEHGEIAENLLAGRGFSVTFLGREGPTSQQTPLYPVLLAGAYRLFGLHAPTAILAMQLLQCVAGSALVLVVYWLTRSLLPDRPALAWIAGCGAAVYPAHVYMVTHIQVAVWAALLVTLLMAVVHEPAWRGRRGVSVSAGLVGGALLLFEPIMALALPIVAVLLWRRRPLNGVANAVAFVGTALLVIAPWLARNALVHGEFVFIKSTFGYALWQGNNPASWGTDKIPLPSAETLRTRHDGRLAAVDRAMWEARHETLYIDDVLLKPHGYGQFAGMSEPERSRTLGRLAMQFILENPKSYAGLCVQRLRYFLLFDETNPKAAHPVYRIATVVWLFACSVGLVVLRDRWRVLWPVVAVFAAVTVFHTLTIVSARFRIPIEPLSLVWASAAIAAGWTRVIRSFSGNGQSRRELSQTGNVRAAA